MELSQLKSFIAVATLGSITRASEHLNRSQPAVSAHIKGLEETLGLRLFERTSRGMALTHHGEQVLPFATDTLRAHGALLTQADLLRGTLTGRLRLGVDENSDPEVLASLLPRLTRRRLEVSLHRGDASEIINSLCRGELDVGIYNEPEEPPEGLTSTCVSHFGLFLATPTCATTDPPDWSALATLPWICPPPDSRCGRVLDGLLEAQGVDPAQRIRVDSEEVTRTLIAARVGVGLLHAYTAREAEARREVDLVWQADQEIRVMFGHQKERGEEPVIRATFALARDLLGGSPSGLRHV